MKKGTQSGIGGQIVGGLILMAVGLWFLLGNFGIQLPGINRFWPVFPTIGGLLFILSFFTGREKDAGVLIPGIGGFLVGLFFFFFTFRIFSWSDMADLWPVFPLIGGLAFVAAFLFGRPKEPGLLVPGLGGIAVGLVGLTFTIVGLSLAWITTYWPVILILLGLIILFNNLGGRQKS